MIGAYNSDGKVIDHYLEVFGIPNLPHLREVLNIKKVQARLMRKQFNELLADGRGRMDAYQQLAEDFGVSLCTVRLRLAHSPTIQDS